MKNIFYLICISTFLSCNYARFTRHVKVDLNDSKDFNQGGAFNKIFIFSSSKLLNSVTENIDAVSAKIENLQIENLQLSISLLPNNTATRLTNVHIKFKRFNGAQESLAKLDTNKVLVNQGNVFALNSFLILKGVDKVKSALVELLSTGKHEIFELEMSGTMLPGEVFRANVKLILKASLDAVICERIPFGLGPSDCN